MSGSHVRWIDQILEQMGQVLILVTMRSLVCPAVDVGKAYQVLGEDLVFATRDFPKCTLSRGPASDGAFEMQVGECIMYLGRCTDY
jgi:hypothetical protein